MKTTSITSLRTELSRYLDAVRNGETVEIRDRRVPIARLVLIEPATADGKGAIPPWLERLRRTGVVRVGRMKGVPAILRERPPGWKAGAVDALLEERQRSS